MFTTALKYRKDAAGSVLPDGWPVVECERLNSRVDG